MDEELKIWLQCAARQASEMKRSLLLTRANVDVLGQGHSKTSIPENLEKFLTYTRNRRPRPGRRVTVDRDRDYTVIDAKDAGELILSRSLPGFGTREDGPPIREAFPAKLTPQGLP